MKRIFSIFYMFVLLVNTLEAQQCESILKELYQANLAVIQSDMYYMKFSVQSIKGEESTKDLVSEIWFDKGKIRYENDFALVLSDKKESVSISKSNRQIVIMKVPETQDAKVPLLGLNSQLDSLKKIALTQSCARTNNVEVLIFDFPLEQKYNYMPYRRVELYYDHTQKRQTGGKYYACTDRGGRIDTYQYLVMEARKSQSVEMNPLSEIYAGGKLKAKYAGYKLVDLRTDKN